MYFRSIYCPAACARTRARAADAARLCLPGGCYPPARPPLGQGVRPLTLHRARPLFSVLSTPGFRETFISKVGFPTSCCDPSLYVAGESLRPGVSDRSQGKRSGRQPPGALPSTRATEAVPLAPPVTKSFSRRHTVEWTSVPGVCEHESQPRRSPRRLTREPRRKDPRELASTLTADMTQQPHTLTGTSMKRTTSAHEASANITVNF